MIENTMELPNDISTTIKRQKRNLRKAGKVKVIRPNVPSRADRRVALRAEEYLKVSVKKMDRIFVTDQNAFLEGQYQPMIGLEESLVHTINECSLNIQILTTTIVSLGRPTKQNRKMIRTAQNDLRRAYAKYTRTALILKQIKQPLSSKLILKANVQRQTKFLTRAKLTQQDNLQILQKRLKLS